MPLAIPFFALLSVATIVDFATRRIPNYLILIGLVYALSTALFFQNHTTLLDTLLGALFSGVVFILPYRWSMLGAGDVKLAMVVGAFLGPYLALIAMLYAAIVGGITALIYLASKGLLGQSIQSILRLNLGTSRIPYAYAIASGAFLAVLYPNLL